MAKKIIKLLLWLIILLKIISVSAHDEVLEYNFSWLGLFNSWSYELPYNLFDFTLDHKSQIYLSFDSYDCDTTWEFQLYINWTDLIVNCTWWNNEAYFIELWQDILDIWSYEVYIDNYWIWDWFALWDLNIYINYVYLDSYNSYDEEYKKIGFFNNYEDFIDFSVDFTIFYLISLFVVMLFLFWQIIFDTFS